MGILTKCVACLKCNEKYRLRYNIGNKFPQSATFPCHNCGEDLSFGVGAEDNMLKNIIEIPFDMQLKVVNLHPELALDPKSMQDPKYFPSLDFMFRQSQKGSDAIGEFKSAQRSCILYQQKWDAIQTDFRYLKEARWALLENKYNTDHKITSHKILMAVFDAADQFLQGKWAALCDQALDEVGKAYRHSGYHELYNYLLEFKDDFLMNKLYEVMKTYRDVEEALLPTLLHQKCNFAPEGLTSTVNWEKIKMVYGDLYEIYGDLLLIPTTINNLLSRNRFDQFASDSFSLHKYIDADKSGKAENFKANPNLAVLSEFYDSGIRNGTHHKACIFDKETQVITFKTGRGGRGRKFMPLINYIEYCNELYARLLIVAKCYYLVNIMEPSSS